MSIDEQIHDLISIRNPDGRSNKEKMEILEEANKNGETFYSVSQKHSIPVGQLFLWKKQLKEGIFDKDGEDKYGYKKKLNSNPQIKKLEPGDPTLKKFQDLIATKLKADL